MRRLISIAIFAVLTCAGLAQQPLKILQAEVNEAAGTLTVMGTNFGISNPQVTLAGQPLTILSYTADSNPLTSKEESVVESELPSPIQPGTYLLRVADSLNPETVFDEFNVQIGGTTSTQLMIRSVEPNEETQDCVSPCAGTLLISGLNLGSDPVFSGAVSLFLPGQGELPLPVLAFNPITQEILTELPIDFAGVSGSLLLAVSAGGGQGEFDVFDMTLEGDFDPTNELQTLSRSGNDLSLSQGGGTVSINDPDADPTNELQTLSQAGSTLSLSRNGGTVSINDADPDPTNELQTLTQVGNVLSLSGNGGTVTVSSDDADADPTNEIQALSTSGTTIQLSRQDVPFELNPDIITRGGMNNTAIGQSALGNATFAWGNTAVGFFALRSTTTSSSNTAVGSHALEANTNGPANVAIGDSALLRNTTGGSNIAIGVNSLFKNTAGGANLGIGTGSLSENTTGSHNTAIGFASMTLNVTGEGNVALGHHSLQKLTSGLSNIAIGAGAGAFLTNESYNILMGNPGVAGDNQTIRIGTSQQRAFMAGIYSTDVGAAPLSVVVNADGQLGTAAAGTVPGLANQSCPAGTQLAGFDEQGGLLCLAGSTLIDFDELPLGTPMEGVTIAGATFSMPNKTGGGPFQISDIGTGVGLNGPAIPVHIVFDSPPLSMSFDYTANPLVTTVTLEVFDDENVLVGSQVVDLEQDPNSVWHVGFVELTAPTPFRTAIVTTLATGTAFGFVLDNLRFGSQPQDGDSDPTNELQTLYQVGDSIALTDGGDPIPLNPHIVISPTPTDNTGVGINVLSKNTGHDNTAAGHSAMRENTSGSTNTALGAGALLFNSSGSRNTGLGGLALQAMRTGSNNTALGTLALKDNAAGSNNIAIGYDAGNGAPLNASANIFIGARGNGSDTGATIRIGEGQVRTFLAGVLGTSLDPSAAPVVIDSNGQLGTGVFPISNDNDPGNELQDLTRTGNLLALTGSPSSVSVDDADADPSNEIQSLVQNPDTTISISGSPGSVPLNPFIVTQGTGSNNTALGRDTLGPSQGTDNTAVGRGSLLNTSIGSRNTAVGVGALTGNNAGISGGSNTVVGWNAMDNMSTGAQNTGLGALTLKSIASGSNNIAVGYRAGFSLAATANSNILIGHEGESTDSATIRIGTPGTHGRAFLAGVRGLDVGSTALPVVIDENGRLGTTTFPDGGLNLVRTVIVSPVPNDPAASGSALLAALGNITDASASNPYLLKLEPGVFDLGATTLVMKSFVDIEGSGEDQTVIKATGGSIGGPTEAVLGVDNAGLRFLSVEGSSIIALHLRGDTRVSHVSARFSGLGSRSAIAVTGAGPTLSDVVAIAEGLAHISNLDVAGISHNGSTARLNNIRAEAAGGIRNMGMKILGGASPSLHNVKVQGVGGETAIGLRVEYNGFDATEFQGVVAVGRGGSIASSGISCDSPAQLTFENVVATAEGPADAHGLFQEGTGVIRFHRSTLQGSTRGAVIANAAFGNVFLGSVSLQGGILTNGGVFKCAASYSQNFDPLASNCLP